MSAINIDTGLRLLALVLPAVLAFAAVKFSLKQVVKDVEELKNKTEDKDASHDTQLADQDKRLAVLESKFDTVIRQMQAQLADIYQKLIGS